MKKTPGSLSLSHRLSLFLLPLAGIALLWCATAPHRVGVSPDTRAYLSIAHHLHAGHGVSAYYSDLSEVSQPIAAWPPLFPVLISAPMALGVDPLDAAWVINLLLFGVNLWLAGRIMARACGSVAAGWAVQAMLILSQEWRWVFVWAISEPLFILLIHAAVWFTLNYLETRRGRDLVAAALAVGLAGLTRYIGGVYIPLFALTVLLYQRAGPAERFKNSVRFLILAMVPPSVWAVRNYLRLDFIEMTPGVSWADRVFGSLMHPQEHANSLWFNVRTTADMWVHWAMDMAGGRMPESWALCAAAGGLVMTLLAIAAGLSRRFRHSRSAPLAALLGLLAVGYSAGLIGGLTFSSFSGGIDPRYVFPTATHMILLAAVLLFGSGTAPGRWKFLRITAVAGLLLWSVMRLPDTAGWTAEMRRDGVDQTAGRRWLRTYENYWFPTEERVRDFRMWKRYHEQSLGRSF